ncbi:MAG: VanZ family protein [Oscillospiraceae bacterium]|nr:VanZ family protein [Oscillospiraceae bacterium]
MRKRRIVAALFWIWLAVLLRITVFRSGWYHNDLFGGTVVWFPFRTIFAPLAEGRWWDFLYLFVGNLIWFVPMGAYLRYRRRALLPSLFWTALLSLGIEVLQFVLSTGCSEVEDLLLNTAGGCLGWLAVHLICKKRSAAI